MLSELAVPAPKWPNLLWEMIVGSGWFLELVPPCQLIWIVFIGSKDLSDVCGEPLIGSFGISLGANVGFGGSDGPLQSVVGAALEAMLVFAVGSNAE